MEAFCTRSCPFSSPSSSFTSKSLQSWTRNVRRNASESGWKRSNRRIRKPPVHPREPRVAAVSGFPDTAGRVPAGNPKTGRCADVRENKKFDRSPAQRLRSKEEMRRNGRDLPLAAGRGIWSLHRRKAGQSRGVVRAPRRSHLPAVRAVSGICEDVPKAAKISSKALQYEKSPPFQGKRRGSNEKYGVKAKFALWITPECKQHVLLLR